MISEGLSLVQMETALKRLDNLLDTISDKDCLPIDIRAVGGFALIVQGIRRDGVTLDIDTVTMDYPDPVSSMIEVVAREYKLEKHWLNNQTVYSASGIVSQEDVDAFDSSLDAHYKRFNLGLRNIRVSVADMPTLARCKALAVQDIPKGIRTIKDAFDLKDILKSMGYRSIDDAEMELEWLNAPEYSQTVELMKEFERTNSIQPDLLDDFDLSDLLDNAYDTLDYFTDDGIFPSDETNLDAI